MQKIETIGKQGPRLTLEEMARRDLEIAVAHGKIWGDIFSTLFDPRPSKREG